MSWLWSSCIYGAVVFAPQPNISAFELATICQHGGCRQLPIADPDKIPENLKRHFRPYKCEEK